MKLLRLYNQNRGKIWTIIAIIIFILMMISLLNKVYEERNQQEMEQAEMEETPKYEKESETMVTGGNVGKEVREDFGDLISNFLTYCQNHEPEKAYGLLSEDCKEILYPTEEIFNKQYYESRFSSGPKRFSFQSYTSSDTYIYMIKIFPDMMATGMGTAEQYIQDYISIIKENENYKLNVNGFIGRININKKETKNNITIEVNKREIYMDYSIYAIKIKNDSENTILLDSRNKTNTMYVVDRNKIKFKAMLHENIDTDFEIASGEEKEIKVKFSDSYKEKIPIDQIVFSDIHTDINANEEEEILKMEINLK